jgi:hypothetical protein
MRSEHLFTFVRDEHPRVALEAWAGVVPVTGETMVAQVVAGYVRGRQGLAPLHQEHVQASTGQHVSRHSPAGTTADHDYVVVTSDVVQGTAHTG